MDETALYTENLMNSDNITIQYLQNIFRFRCRWTNYFFKNSKNEEMNEYTNRKATARPIIIFSARKRQQRD